MWCCKHSRTSSHHDEEKQDDPSTYNGASNIVMNPISREASRSQSSTESLHRSPENEEEDYRSSGGKEPRTSDPVLTEEPVEPSKEERGSISNNTESIRTKRSRSTSISEYRKPFGGALWRQNDLEPEDWSLMWFVIEGNSLFYYRTKDEHNLRKAPAGFFYLNDDMVLDPALAAGSGHPRTRSKSASGEFVFSMTFNGTVGVTLAAETPTIRSRWCENLEAAQAGAWFADETNTYADDTKSDNKLLNLHLLRLPQISGMLKKKSMGRKRIAFSGGEKTRYFKLSGSTLRYYKDESLKPSSLKGTIQLEGCEVLRAERDTDIFLKLPDGHVLRCHASDKAVALEWIAALSTTCRALRKGTSIGADRRHNVKISEEIGQKRPSSPGSIKDLPDETRRILVASLGTNFIFKDALDHLDDIVDDMHEVCCQAGDCVVREGEMGDALFVLVEGEAEVIQRGEVKAQLERGDIFGELSMIHAFSPRNATVRALSPVRLFELTRSDFRNQRALSFQNARQEQMSFLLKIDLFQSLPQSSVERLVDVLKMVSFEKGEYIFRQDDDGDALYVIYEGEVMVTQNKDIEQEVARLNPGSWFGELALLHTNGKRNSSVKALSTKVLCYTIDRKSFEALLGPYKDAMEVHSIVLVLKTSPFSKHIESAQLEALAREVRRKPPVRFSDSAVILREEDADADQLFMLAAGEIVVKRRGKMIDGFSEGSCYGAEILIGEKQIPATLIARGPVTLKVLTREDVDRAVGRMGGVKRLARQASEKNASFRERAVTLATAKIRGRSASSPEPPSVDVDDFEVLQVLGSGSFGGVKLVSSSVDGRRRPRLLALRVVFKTRVLENNYTKRIYLGRDIWCLFEQRCIARLYSTFSDADHLYFLMEYCHGGDLFQLLHDDSRRLPTGRFGGMTLSHAKFYAANVLTILRVLQDNSIVHRALCPENMLIDRSGYLKLGSFEVSKKLESGEQTGTMCGVAEYLAPEVIAVKGYGRSVDLWAFGCLVFELLTNCSPFFSENDTEIFSRIVHSEKTLGHILEQRSFDKDTESILRALLRHNPSERLGSLIGGTSDIWEHAWFRGTDEVHIESQLLTAPFLPPDAQNPLEYEARAGTGIYLGEEEYGGPRKLFLEWTKTYNNTP